jgi:RNA polymerase sigma-70 factor (ECF subfamily)
MTAVTGSTVLSWIAVQSHQSGTPQLTSDDASLVSELLRTGNDDLFAELVKRHQERVLRLVISVLGPGHESEAEDLVQEVFVLVYRKLATFRGECAFATWLYRLTKNLALDRRRHARLKHPHIGDELLALVPARDSHSDPESMASAAERRRQVLDHLEQLPDPQRMVVYLYYWMGSPVNEIAQLLELKQGTVKSHLHRARQRLATVLSEDLCHG